MNLLVKHTLQRSIYMLMATEWTFPLFISVLTATATYMALNFT